MSATASRRIGRTSSGPATTRIAVIPATRSSGNPHRESRCPSSGTQSDTIAPPSTIPSAELDHQRHRDVAGEQPAPSQKNVGHDEEREPDRGDEQPAPHRIRPAEHGDDRVPDLPVLPHCGRGDDRCEPDDDRPEREEHPVDRPAVPPPQPRRPSGATDAGSPRGDRALQRSPCREKSSSGPACPMRTHGPSI